MPHRLVIKEANLRAENVDVQGHTAITARVVVSERNAWLEDDREITAANYGGEFRPDGSFRVIRGVWGVRMENGEMIQYYQDDSYNEVEGYSTRWELDHHRVRVCLRRRPE